MKVSGINITLQKTVDAENSITLLSSANRGIDITVPDLRPQYSTGIFVTVNAQTGGSGPNSDAFVAKINGQNPGILTDFVGGFSAIATGADNWSFVSEHLAGATTSIHFRGNNYTGATSEFIRFTTDSLDVFRVDYLGNATANKFIIPGGSNTQYLMADGSTSSGTGGTGSGYFLPLTGGTLTGTLNGTRGSFSQSSSSSNTLYAYSGFTAGTSLSAGAANGIASYFVNNSTTYPVLRLLGLSSTKLIEGRSISDAITFSVTSVGDVTANKFIKTDGTSSQFLMADGSVSSGFVPYTGATDAVDLGANNLYIGTGGASGGNITVQGNKGVSYIDIENAGERMVYDMNSIVFTSKQYGGKKTLSVSTTAVTGNNYSINFPDASGTVALTKYKVYTALLSQGGTADPTATVLENTLGGTVSWTRNSTGNYYGTLTGMFPDINKVFCIFGMGETVSSYGDNINLFWGVYSNNQISITTVRVNNNADSTLSKNPIEIRVYP